MSMCESTHSHMCIPNIANEESGRTCLDWRKHEHDSTFRKRVRMHVLLWATGSAVSTKLHRDYLSKRDTCVCGVTGAWRLRWKKRLCSQNGPKELLCVPL